MWQRFTDEARRAMFHAQEEAQRLGTTFIDVNHLVLGFLKSETVAFEILVQLKTDIELLRETLSVEATSSLTAPAGEMRLDVRSKRIIELAFSESRSLGQSTIGTEHILLGILAGGNRPEVRTLNDLGVGFDDVKKIVLAQDAPVFEPPNAAPIQASSSLKLVSYQTSGFLALRQGVASADYLALFLLADRPPVLCDRLLNLGMPISEIVTAIEVAIMSGPSSVTSDAPSPTDLMIAAGGDPSALFLSIALHASCNTGRAFASLGITPKQLYDALSVSQQKPDA